MGKNIILFIILSVSLVSVRGFGAKKSCIFSSGKTVKDYSIDPKDFPGVKSENDISRNQDSVEWCQSFAAADLLCYHINKNSEKKLNDQCSASDLRLNYGPKDSTVNGSNQEATSYKILNNYDKKKGVCPEKIFPSEYWKNTELLTKELYEKLESKDKNKQTEAIVSLYELCPECMARTNGESAKNIIDKLNQNSIDKLQLLKKLNAKLCDGNRVGTNVNYDLRVSSPQDDMRSILKSQLENKQPVIITLKTPQKISPNISPDSETKHIVLVIGMDIRDNGQGVEDCYFTVKNSWGRGCDYIVKNNPSIQCDPKNGLLYISTDMFTPEKKFAEDAVWISGAEN